LTQFYNEARTLRGKKEKEKKSGQNPHANKENSTSSQYAKKLKTTEMEIEPER
jgi:hypothetical protein